PGDPWTPACPDSHLLPAVSELLRTVQFPFSPLSVPVFALCRLVPADGALNVHTAASSIVNANSVCPDGLYPTCDNRVVRPEPSGLRR
ncbi:hypothetical protein T06_11862, partial [Trichinella sp. T6]